MVTYVLVHTWYITSSFVLAALSFKVGCLSLWKWRGTYSPPRPPPWIPLCSCFLLPAFCSAINMAFLVSCFTPFTGVFSMTYLGVLFYRAYCCFEIKILSSLVLDPEDWYLIAIEWCSRSEVRIDLRYYNESSSLDVSKALNPWDSHWSLKYM